MPMKIEVTKETIARKARSSEPNPFDAVVAVCAAELAESPADDRGSKVRKVAAVTNLKKAINALRRAAKDADVSALTELTADDETTFKFQIVDKIVRKPKTAASA